MPNGDFVSQAAGAASMKDYHAGQRAAKQGGMAALGYALAQVGAAASITKKVGSYMDKSQKTKAVGGLQKDVRRGSSAVTSPRVSTKTGRVLGKTRQSTVGTGIRGEYSGTRMAMSRNSRLMQRALDNAKSTMTKGQQKRVRSGVRSAQKRGKVASAI